MLNDAYRMREQPNFRAVLNNCDDQVVVRQLLIELVAPEVKVEIVNRFNEFARRYNREREESAEAEGS